MSGTQIRAAMFVGIVGLASTGISVHLAVAASSSRCSDQQRVSLVGPGAISRWAYVLQSTSARSAPRATSRAIATIETSTPLGQPNLVELLAEQADASGHQWLRIRLPVLPNGETGWVRRTALDRFQIVRTHLLIDRRSLTATLYRSGVVVFRSPVGVGRPDAPTPAGQFYVREELRNFNDSFYGPIAFGTNARSSVLTDWPGGGFIGIHGTNEPQLVPGRVSHGCIRMRNADIRRLARLMPLGTPVTIL
jgi:L,D-transpeptidase-like protein